MKIPYVLTCLSEMINKKKKLNDFISSGSCWTYVVQNLHHLSSGTREDFVSNYTKSLFLSESLRNQIEKSVESNLTLDLSQNTIWFFWLQGLSDAPESVKISLRSWKTLNPEYNVIVLTKDNLGEYFPFWDAFSLSNLQIGIAHKSDFLRTYLTYFYGGIWVDATTFCFKPLSAWLPTVLSNTNIFFPKQGEKCPDRLIKNWLLAANKGNIFSKKLLKKLYDYIFEYRSSPIPIKFSGRYIQCCREKWGKLTPEKFNLNTLQEFEKEGFSSYYYYHYLYNDIVQNHNSISPISLMSEYIASYPHICPGTKTRRLDDSIYVTKQSHRQHHLNSPEYKERKQIIMSILT